MKNTLNIDKKSLGLITIAKFFFEDYSNDEEFIRECGGMNGVQIKNWLNEYRIIKISETRFKSQADFVEAFMHNPRLSLERLFQERITDDKLRKLQCKDPNLIYSYHIKDQNLNFNSFTEYFL